MNLKEAFHYQTVLDGWMQRARNIFALGNGAFDITKNHMYSKSDETRPDVTEAVEFPLEVRFDDVVKFMDALVKEKYELTKAVADTESKLGFCISAEISANKYRSDMIRGLRNILDHKEHKSTTTNVAYRFNNEGNQISYIYDVETVYKEAFDRKADKELLKKLEAERNAASLMIEAAHVNSVVDFIPTFDETETLEEIVAEYFAEKGLSDE